MPFVLPEIACTTDLYHDQVALRGWAKQTLGKFTIDILWWLHGIFTLLTKSYLIRNKLHERWRYEDVKGLKSIQCLLV